MTGNVFLAVPLSDEERHAVASLLSERDLARRVPGKRTRPENWHITVRFIGEASEVQTERLAERVQAHLDVPPATAMVRGIDGFPRTSRATVVYLAIDDRDGTLDAIAGACSAAAEDVGFEPEGRPFVPHLTLSRVRPAQPIASAHAEPPLDTRVVIDRVHMFRSIPERGGVRHETLHEFPL